MFYTITLGRFREKRITEAVFFRFSFIVRYTDCLIKNTTKRSPQTGARRLVVGVHNYNIIPE